MSSQQMARLTALDKCRRLACQWLGPWPAYRIEHYIGKLVGMATAGFRAMQPAVFLWGPGRSGSYLLYDILSVHPGLICPRSVLRDNKGLYGTQHYGGGEYDYLLANPYPPIEGFKRFIDRPYPRVQREGHWSADDARGIYCNYARFTAGASRSKRFLDKAPWYTFVLDLLEEVFPDAQHICCARHPISTAMSYFRRMTEPDALDAYGFWGWKPTGWQEYQGRSLEDRATWLAIETIRQAEHNVARLGARCIVVRYEELIERPHREMRRVSRFLHLPWWEGRLEALPEQFPNYNRALRVPTADTALADELHELCEATGYSASAVA